MEFIKPLRCWRFEHFEPPRWQRNTWIILYTALYLAGVGVVAFHQSHGVLLFPVQLYVAWRALGMLLLGDGSRFIRLRRVDAALPLARILTR